MKKIYEVIIRKDREIERSIRFSNVNSMRNFVKNITNNFKQESSSYIKHDRKLVYIIDDRSVSVTVYYKTIDAIDLNFIE